MKVGPRLCKLAIVRYTGFYVIRGNDRLVARVREREIEVLDLIVGPFLWSHEQGGVSAYTLQDHQGFVKRAFLAHLQCLALEPGVIERVIDELRIADEIFDLWWTMEAFQGLDESVSDVADQLRRAGRTDALEQIGLPGVGV